ncbi:MAG TPA: hypothetical protein VIM70_04230 [Clostridium sp.]|uniref:hypothetical protein n=1 Tax=Clostridium sp. TaxID=1506 RepID=UPI002F95E5B4
MIVRINGSELNKTCIHPMMDIDRGILVNQWIDMGKKVENAFKNYLLPSSILFGVINLADPVFAAVAHVVPSTANPVGTSNLIVSLWPIITMIQDLALPIGIIVSIWGMVEMIIGSPGWKQKLKFAVIGYVSMFIIPTFFVAIHNAFSAIPIIIPK